MILNWNFVGMWFDLTDPETSWLAHRDALDVVYLALQTIVGFVFYSPLAGL
jgi:hypothetical protein